MIVPGIYYHVPREVYNASYVEIELVYLCWYIRLKLHLQRRKGTGENMTRIVQDRPHARTRRSATSNPVSWNYDTWYLVCFV